jgi:predicted enzyme involved in methoxymalonyl-ACP biosynthesis
VEYVDFQEALLSSRAAAFSGTMLENNARCAADLQNHPHMRLREERASRVINWRNKAENIRSWPMS